MFDSQIMDRIYLSDAYHCVLCERVALQFVVLWTVGLNDWLFGSDVGSHLQ
jgi:hypothetical protein